MDKQFLYKERESEAINVDERSYNWRKGKVHKEKRKVKEEREKKN